MKKAILLLVILILLQSCTEQVKIIELQKVEVTYDTSYYYKVMRIEENPPTYYITKKDGRFQNGEIIDSF